MKQLLDLVPIILFVITFKFAGIYAATVVLMVATVIQTGAIYLMDKKLSLLHKVTLALVLIFGGLTLALHDERFIKWKPTFMYFLMAGVLGGALWAMKKNLLAIILGSQLTLPEKVWHRLCVAWVWYCVFMAVSNGYVAQYYTTEQWVNFKLWGYIFPVIFFVGQGFYIAKHWQQAPEADTLSR